MNPENKSELIVYQSSDGQVKLDVRLENETVWLTQEQIAALFATTKQNVSKHIANIFTDGELSPEQTVNEKLTVVENRRRYRVKHYNLDVIISVGYRINSVVATRFRQWAIRWPSGFVASGYQNDGFTKKFRRFFLKPVMTTIPNHRPLKIFTPPFKISFTTRLPVKQLPN